MHKPSFFIIVMIATLLSSLVAISSIGTVYSLTMDTDLLSVADSSFWGENINDLAGIAVAPAGDVNGDGYDDFLIGAQQNDDGGENAGKTYLIFGRASGWAADTNLSNADASFIGENGADYSGNSLAPAGDVNADGYDDFLIGVYQNDDGGTEAGQTYLILGKESGWTPDTDLSTADASFWGESDYNSAGRAVSSVGDINADGYSDFLIGAPGQLGHNETYAGQTYLILGKESGWTPDTDLSKADASFWGEAPADLFGITVALAGDVNGDDYDDFLIGARHNDDGGSDAGQTYLVFGKDSGWTMDTHISVTDASFHGENSDDYAGNALATVGDINGDGYDDFLLSATNSDDGGNNAGQIYLILGKTSGWLMDTDLSDAYTSFIGEDANDYAGSAVAAAGDVNGDGYDDFLIGAYLNDEGGVNAGQTYLVLGQSPPNAPARPLCEGDANPANVNDYTPEFSWTFSDNDVGDFQAAYQILVSSSSEHLSNDFGNMWASGVISSTASGNIPYGGSKDLMSGTTYFWKVKTWDNRNAEGSFCSEQTFTMEGVLSIVPLRPSGLIYYAIGFTIGLILLGGLMAWAWRK